MKATPNKQRKYGYIGKNKKEFLEEYNVRVKLSKNISVLQKDKKIDFGSKEIRVVTRLAINNKKYFKSLSNHQIQNALQDFSAFTIESKASFERPCCSKRPASWPLCKRGC
ncbi:MAG: hypothetical protein PHW18_06165 [Sulfuricurvum sp.]|uniref:hypothetical protein n=1 Tax=Sulfuricurvum sp. TaxID=2025608 RepID=UPI0026239719|nr:hypothetical protein [Sulfuricurvum sp.]MDD2829140.1 hypothetical protein [Sulfuricurvum sp.]MDD4950189.1 hypothetical protein [Sulfuricurvum sp.]